MLSGVKVSQDTANKNTVSNKTKLDNENIHM